MTKVTYLDDLATRIRSATPPGALPHEDTRALFRTYAVLLLAKGSDVTPADVHNAWVAWMIERDPSHEALMPYDALPPDVARADQPFVSAIRAVAETIIPQSEERQDE